MKKTLSPVRLLSLGYIITIIIGTLLLLLPISNKSGSISFLNALFTATSATCVTGLTVVDTAAQFTIFGQVVIMLLIQIGGLGFMTIITLILMIFKKNISIYNRTVMMQSAGSYNISGIRLLIKRIIIGTFIFEFVGAIFLFGIFLRDYSFGEAIFKSVFHSISAFCNAGFDNLGSVAGSISDYQSNYLFLFTIMFLIVIGGSGFIFWSDLIDSKFKFNRLQLHSKIVIVFNLILIIVPAILFFLFEFTTIGNGGSFTDLSFSDKLVNSLFLAVSPRTAGFSTLDLSKLTSSGKTLNVILMFIGGNPGSTAGGMKVTTIIIIMANLYSQMRRQNKVVLFKRRVPEAVIKQSSALFMAYIALILTSSLIISAFDTFSFEQVLFETTSAVGTVGLSLGVSTSGNIVTKMVLIMLMYAGRLGALQLFSVFVNNKNEYILQEPTGKVLVG